MRKTILTIAVAFFACMACAQLPPVQDVEFVRKSFIRNYYNLRIPYARINMRGTHLFMEHASNLIVTQLGKTDAGLSQDFDRLVISAGKGQTETLVRCSDFNPFLCYEVGFDNIQGEQGLAFYTDRGAESRRIIVYKKAGKLGVRTPADTLEVEDHHEEAMTLRVQCTGARLHVFVVTAHCDSLAFSYHIPYEIYTTGKHWSLRDVEDWNFGAYAKLPEGGQARFNKVEASFASGTGQADPSVVQYKDGSPYIKDGKLYVMLTTRGFDQIPDSHQGIYRIDLTTFQWELMGSLAFTRDGDGFMHPYHATRAVWDGDSGQWLIMTVSHGEDHQLMQGTTRADILHGFHVVNVSALNEPHWDTHTDEDPDFLYDAGRRQWLLAYVSVVGDKGYQTVLAAGKSWNGPYREVALSEVGNETGTRILKANGTYTILSGGSDYNVLHYPDLRRIGGLKVRYPDGGFRGWAAITAIPWNDCQRYLWITFDRGRDFGRYSYGTLYVYLSKAEEAP